MIRLSNRQKKNADRAAGIELMIRLPAHLRAPKGLREDEEEDGGDAEYEAARALLEPQLGEDGLAIKKVKIGVVRSPFKKDTALVVAPYLIVHIVGFRWFHAVDPPAPLVMWHADSMKPGDAGNDVAVDSITMKPPEAEKRAIETSTESAAASRPHDWNSDPRPFSECLTAWDQGHGWSIIEAAQQMRLDDGTYRQWRDGRRKPRMEETLRLLMTLIDRALNSDSGRRAP